MGSERASADLNEQGSAGTVRRQTAMIEQQRLAAQFALAEIVVVVARLLADLELTAVGAEPQVTLQVTTRSATGLNVAAKRRN